MTNSDYANDLEQLANTPSQAESMLQFLDQLEGCISLYVNANKTEIMRFKPETNVFILSGKPWKLGNQFTYVTGNISSTEIDVNKCIRKVWTAIGRLSILWKSDPSDEIKREFFQAVSVSTVVLMYHLDSNETHGEKARWELHNNTRCSFEQNWKSPPLKNGSCVANYFPSHKPSKLNKQNTQGTAGDIRTNS